MTPFNVEYARKSRSRAWAPTLIPVDSDGGQVNAQVLLLKETISVEQAMDILYQREKHSESQDRYDPLRKFGPDDIQIRTTNSLPGIRTALYTWMARNIDDMSARTLAKLAIASVSGASPGEDGISYLISAKSYGIETPLTQTYESEILRQSETSSLGGALDKQRRAVSGTTKPLD
jgi:hypothetical protein